MKRTMALLALLALPFAAWAENRDQLVKQYSDFAGSDANSRSLVDGLRDGKEVKLSDGKTTTTFTPATGKMGNGNIDIALSLAQQKLRQQGITNPTSEQLKAALMGDATNPGILQQRADGRGWGQIANSMGMKLGDVMRSEKAERMARAERRERPEKPEKPERPERPEKPERGR